MIINDIENSYDKLGMCLKIFICTQNFN